MGSASLEAAKGGDSGHLAQKGPGKWTGVFTSCIAGLVQMDADVKISCVVFPIQ